jgi:hypothetical protein
MSTTAFPQSAIGLPVSLKYDLPPSLSDSARSWNVSVGPDGQTSVVGQTPPSYATLFPAVTSTTVPSIVPLGSFNSQVISFTIPSGMSESVFMDPASTTLSFSLTYKNSTSYTAPTTAPTSQVLQLIGGAYSFIDQMVVYSNSVPIETINQYGLLQNFLLNNTVNMSERQGGLSICCGCDSNSGTGIELGFAGADTVNYRYNFCIPLCSVIGYNTDKLIPVGSINNLSLQLTTASITPIIAVVEGKASATAASGQMGPLMLSEFQLNMRYIDVGDMAANLLKQTLQDGKWFIKSTTYTNSSVTIPANSSGNQQLLLQIRNSSVKSIIHQFGVSNVAQPLLCPNSYYDAINPCLTSRQCQVGGQFYPSKPINDCARAAEGYTYLINSMGGTIPKALGSMVSRDAYNVVIDAIPVGSDTSIVLAANGLRPSPSGGDGGTRIWKFPNAFYCGYDLERCGGTLFSGINTRASPPFLNLFISQANASVTNVTAWGMSDVVLVVDTVAKQVTAFI